ncbi:DNA cytosine methyltransferase [Rubripirellula sp.]|nr:DNA cytosine methyltransferase [Rubripirellula sp.]MDB4645073.1 DNA cytosine methyltransferase [Rubripirellula sp.]
MTQPTVLDLFSGCGGLSLGLAEAGFDIKWANECDEFAADSFRNAHQNTSVFCEDVSRFYSRTLENDRGCPTRGELDLLTGGPPCQGFSGYNRHRSPDDPRNSLVEVFLDFVDLLEPRYVLMENVPGMLSLDGGAVVAQVMSAFEQLEYTAHLGILQAGYYGLPQNRWRVFIWASRKAGELPEFPEPTHLFTRTTIFGATKFRENVIKPPTSGSSLFWKPETMVTVADAIRDLPPIENGQALESRGYASKALSDFQKRMRKESNGVFDHCTKKLGDLMMQRCRAVPKKPGAGWLDLPEELKPENLKRHGDRRYDNRFGRLHWEGTFNTILSDAHPYWGRVFHPAQDRVISVREAARAQGFPDNVRFCGSKTRKYRQVGNAVPPPLAFELGKSLMSVLCQKGQKKRGKK